MTSGVSRCLWFPGQTDKWLRVFPECQFWVRPHGSCQLVSIDCLGFIWWSPFSDMCWKFGRCSTLTNTTDRDRLCASLHLWNCNFLSTAVRIHQLRRIILLRAQEQMAFKCAVLVYKIVYTGLHRHTSLTNSCQVTDVKGCQWLRSASSSSLIVSRTRLSIVMQWPGFSSRRCSCLEQPASTAVMFVDLDTIITRITYLHNINNQGTWFVRQFSVSNSMQLQTSQRWCCRSLCCVIVITY